MSINPYQIKAGSELDNLIHQRVMGKTEGSGPAYSTDQRAAHRVLAKLKSSPGLKVTVGRTLLRDRKWFARYESDPSDGTEVFADSEPLAICRLALLRSLKS